MKIITELSRDGNASVPNLSKKLGVNTSVLYSRIKRLVKRKLIERFTIVVNDRELGYTVKALTGINMDSKMRDNVIDELMKIPEVREISEVTGRFDIIVTMYAKNLDEMHRLISERLGRIQGVQRSESFIEMKRTTKPMPYKPAK